MNLNCYIADDERHAIDVLEAYIQRTPGLALAGTTTKAEQALLDIPQLKPALTFLDIDMPRINGLQIAKEIKELTKIILTTSYREHGPEAYELGLADYLLKPIAFDRFSLSVDRVRQALGQNNQTETAWLVKSALTGQIVQVDIAQILYIQGALNYIEIYLPAQKILTYLTMNEALAKLPQSAFSRIHKSFIVRDNAILALDAATVKLPGNTILPVGRAFRNAFRQKISGRILTSKRLHS
jgi:two-component system LytT family response regulator